MKLDEMSPQVDQALLEKIMDELNEDRYRWDDGDEWFETALDMPSNTLAELLQQIPEELEDVYWKQHIIPYMRELASED